MTGIGENAYTPIMYQDLANSSMGLMSYPYGMGMGLGAGIPQSNFLGETRMRAQASKDEFLSHRAKNKEKDLSLLKKALWFFAGCITIAAIPPLKKSIKSAGGVGKYIKNGWNSFVNWIKN